MWEARHICSVMKLRLFEEVSGKLSSASVKRSVGKTDTS